MRIRLGAVLFLSVWLDVPVLSLLHLRLKTKLINVMRFTSSTSSYNTRAEEARWHSTRAWCARLRTNPKRSVFLEVDLGKEYDIRRLETLGWSAVKKKTRRFILQYKKSGKWVPYLETLKMKVFKGSFCHSSCTISSYPLKEPIIAQHLRIHPFSTQDEVGCLKVRVFGTKPLLDDCTRVGSRVIAKRVRDRPTSYMPGRIVGISRHHVYVRIHGSKALLRVNKQEEHGLILDKPIDRWSLQQGEKVVALFRPFDRLYEASILYTSSPPGHAMVRNEAFFSPDEWLKYNFLRRMKQAHLCYCPSCSCPRSSVRVSCDENQSPFDYGLVFAPERIIELWSGSRILSGQVKRVFFNKRGKLIRSGGTLRISYNPSTIKSCLCPLFQTETYYVIFGFVSDLGDTVVDESSYVKAIENDRTDDYVNLCKELDKS